jgi:hypothetical protein
MLQSQRRGEPYRGLLPATGWIFIRKSRRADLGVLDLDNDWIDLDDEPAQFCMDEHGRVRFRGRILDGVIGTSFCTPLPEGFRAPFPQEFVLANGTDGYANVEALPSGLIRVLSVFSPP